jgi:hypothetical protein
VRMIVSARTENSPLTFTITSRLLAAGIVLVLGSSS